MGGNRSGILGTDAAPVGSYDDDDILGGGAPPGSLGVDPAVAMSTLTITDVRKDWDPDSPKFTDPINVSGANIDKVWNALNKLREWGEGGGNLRMEPAADFERSQSVTLSANLVRRLPTWREMDAGKVKPAEEKAWTHMLRKLMDHEDRHVAIAVEEANKLADKLVGQTLKQGHDLVSAANGALAKRQASLDTETRHGAKEGVPYGDVILDFRGT